MMNDNSNDSGKPIRVGIVGVGNWARHGHLRVLDLLPQYQLAEIFSQRKAAAEQAARDYRIERIADSLDAMLDSDDIDMVLVLNTAPQHAATARRVIAAGKDIYCEWPLTTTLDDTQELADLAKAAGVRHVVGLQRRLAPHSRFVHDLIRDGWIGDLRSARMHVSMNYFQAVRSRALEWTVPPENFSSVVAIYGGHFLDMLFSMTGWPTQIAALMPNQFPEVRIKDSDAVIATSTPDQLALIARLPGTANPVASVHIEGGKRSGSGVTIDITGTRGDLRIVNASAFGDAGDDYQIFAAQGDHQPLLPVPIPDAYMRLPESTLPSAVLELAELYWAHANDVNHGTAFAPTFSDALRMHRLIAAAEQSFVEGRFIDV
jgi:predicted dehydrogenase